jgi:ABC-type siderophore export system fused ATPase/permease subunit
MKIPNNLFPPYCENLDVLNKIRKEAEFARRRLDFYGRIAHTYRTVTHSLSIAVVVLPLVALLIFYSKIPYYTYIFSTLMLVSIVAILTKIRAENRYVAFTSVTMQAGTQWQEWDALLEKVQSGEEGMSLDGTALAFLRQRDRAIYTEVIQYGKVEKEKED